MKLRVVTPITTVGFASAAQFAGCVLPDTEVSHAEIERGPASIECALDEALATPDTVAQIVRAERDGMDAAVVNCMGDPGVKPGREAVSIPVVGPCEASMHLASMLGHAFSVLTVLDRLRPQFANQAKIYGVPDKLASVRAVNIPVLELDTDRDAMVEALTDQAVRAIEDDGAHVLIFGCTGMFGAAGQVAAALAARGYDGIPVIDPVVAAIRVAEALVALRLTHSKRTYPAPPSKRIVGYDVGAGR